MTTFPQMFKIVPEGIEGNCTISHFGVDDADAKFTSLRAVVTGGRDTYVAPGVYTKLTVNRTLMMTDTGMERRSNYNVVGFSKGDVLIAGLGIGMILLPLLEKPEVTSVTVIEKYTEVVKLVEPHIRAAAGVNASKLKVIVADIFEYVPPKGQKWDTIYFDIWPAICTDNLKEMETLHKKYGSRKKGLDSWMDSWQKKTLQARKRRAKTTRYGFR